MKRIAILGCENSHANSFLKFIKEKEEFHDVEVVGVYSNDPAASEKLREEFGVPVLSDYTDAIGKIDGLVITARHGDLHYPYARPYIESGIPMFIDKPITIKEAEAAAFMKELKTHSIRISGGSSLKQDTFVMKLKADAEAEVGGKTIGGFVRAPFQSENPYGDFYFYAQHLVEMVLEIFGRFPLSVTAHKNGSQIHVLFHYAEYDAVGLFVDRNYLYYASRMAEKATQSFDIPTDQGWFYREFKEFYELLDGAPQNTSYEAFISPVFVMNAIERSLESGKEEAIREIRI